MAFTGSAATGTKIKGHENLVRHNVRVNVEADSINAAVLAPDVDSGDEAFGLFVGNVALDMCQKAGQKRTAAVFVPADRVDEVKAELKEARPPPPGRAPGEGHAPDRWPTPRPTPTREGIGRLSEVADVITGGAEPPRDGRFVSPTCWWPATLTRASSTSWRSSARSQRSSPTTGAPSRPWTS